MPVTRGTTGCSTFWLALEPTSGLLQKLEDRSNRVGSAHASPALAPGEETVLFSSGSLDGAADGVVCGELALLELDTGVVTGRGLSSACAPPVR